jgi:hypothetical protein
MGFRIDLETETLEANKAYSGTNCEPLFDTDQSNLNLELLC